MSRRLAYLSLGANLGERGEALREALRRLGRAEGVQIKALSPFYETGAWGKTDQPDFLNAAACIETELQPLELLHLCQGIELALGRERHEHWGARTIDLDLLHIPGVSSGSEELRLPHPYLTRRAFVLVPLAEIAPEEVIEGRPVREWRDALLAEESRAGGAPQVRPGAELSEPYPLQLIACIDEGRGLGREGQLLLHLQEDMDFFRQKTWNQIVIMGRRTLESLPGGRPLAGRGNIVLSRTLTPGAAAGLTVCRDLPALWRVLGELHLQQPERQCFVIGGGEIYRLLLPYAGEAWLTEIPGRYAADTFLPELQGFALAEKKWGAACCFCRYKRVL